jgi:RNA polymerase sigma-70 factor (ECF subfamily)
MAHALSVPGAVLRDQTPAFEVFFDDHRDRLTRALWLVTRDRHEAEEVAQEAFVRVWERWERIGSLDDPEAYLYRTALNLYRNRRRRAALAVRRLVRWIPPVDPMEAIDDRDVVVRALGRLTPKQRAALVLVDMWEMTSEEAARALGVRPSTVRVLAARARTTLRDEIGGSDA